MPKVDVFAPAAVRSTMIGEISSGFRLEFGYHGEFCPMSIIPKEFQTTIGKGTSAIWGVAIFSKIPFRTLQKTTYAGSPENLAYRGHDLCNRVVIVGDVTSEDGKMYSVATTHLV